MGSNPSKALDLELQSKSNNSMFHFSLLYYDLKKSELDKFIMWTYEVFQF